MLGRVRGALVVLVCTVGFAIVAIAIAAGALSAALASGPRTSVACSLDVTAPAGSALSQPWEFPASALHGRLGAERGDDAPAAALRAFLASRTARLERFPPHRYLVLRRTPGEMMFGRVSRAGRVNLYISITQTAEGWAFHDGGTCTPSLAYPGRETPTFGLAGSTKSGSHAVNLIVSSGTCDPASSPARRFDRALLDWQPRRLLITVLLRPEKLPAGGLCPGVGENFRLHVRLGRVLGERTVYDASMVPPAAATLSPFRSVG